MGADLYIRTLNDKCRAEWEPKFEAAVAARDAAFPGHGIPVKGNPQRKEFEKLQAAVSEAHEKMYSEGYFRDSYNSWNLFSKIGLSWWQDVIPLQNKKGEIRGPRIKKFVSMLEAHPVTEEAISVFRAQVTAETGKAPEESREELLKYYQTQHAELTAFCRKALELKEPIYASL